MGQIYISSDTHFNHDKSFIWEPRGFNSVEEMNESIISNWNAIVKNDDIVYLLGDVMLGDNETGIACLKRLKGTINILIGNHDTNARLKEYSKLPNINICNYAEVIKYNKYTFYLSHYPTLTSNFDIDKPLKRRIINLCGHSHTNDPFVDSDKGAIYHCEVDAHNCEPILIDDIIKEIEKKWGN